MDFVRGMFNNSENTIMDNLTSAADVVGTIDQSGGIDPILENVTINETLRDYPKVFDDVIFLTDKIVPPFIIAIGIVGNILSFLVLRMAKYGKDSTFIYMRALVFVDSFSLLVYFFLQRYFLNLFPDVFWENGDIFCKEFIFVAFLSMSNSHWMLVLLTVDRFIAVAFPLQWRHLCTPRRSKILCFVIPGVWVLFHVQNFFRVAEPSAGVLKHKCPFDAAFVNPAYLYIFDQIHVTLAFYIPFVSILILNALIVHNVRKSGRGIKKTDVLSRQRHRRERRTTVMLLLVTSVFIVAASPFALDHLFWDVFMPNVEDHGPYYRELRHVLYEIAHTCLILNPASNFYLYCLGCARFRRDLKSVLGFKHGNSGVGKGEFEVTTSSSGRNLKAGQVQGSSISTTSI